MGSSGYSPPVEGSDLIHQLRSGRRGRASRRVRQRWASLLLPLFAAALLTNLTTVQDSQAAVHVPTSVAQHSATSPYPVGVFDENEPSGLAPPAPFQMPGYTEVYADDFMGPLDTSMWGLFSGVPGGDPSGLFETSHVWTYGGMLKIATSRDPLQQNHWASGGLCLCGVHLTYGAFFVRSRETAPGPDAVELLWPLDNSWPPELDFNETGTSRTSSSWTDHYTSPSLQTQATRQINVTHWHTWGVVWTPTSVTFVVDGKAWGQVTAPAQIPTVPMTLDLQSQTWCGIKPECPKHRSTMLIDWVAVFSPTS
jgi:hypothetical protein